MVEELTKCPKCKTRTLVREGEELVCSTCGEHFPAPEKNPDAVALGRLGGQKGGRARSKKLSKEERSDLAKKAVNARWDKERAMKGTTRRNNVSRHRYYEENKEAMIKDLLATGRQKTRKKWGIPAGTIKYLEARWLTNEERAQVEANAGPPWITVDKNGYLPVFPSFSNNWVPHVQLKWLELYGQLRGVHKALDKSG